MPARLGSTALLGFNLGTTPFLSLRLGTTVLWTRSAIRDDFNQADGPLDPAKWTPFGTAPDWPSAVINGAVRSSVPDGLLDVTWGTQASRHRFTGGLSGGADGYLETRVANKGGLAFVTDIYRRGSNTGDTVGVGIRLQSSSLAIVSRVGGTTTERVQCGPYAANDTLRLVQLGNLHTLFRNGQFVGEWNDSTASVPSGASNRSVILYQEGNKALLSPRYFSASLDYIEAN